MSDTSPERPQPERPTGSRNRPTLGSRPGFWPTAALAAASFLLLFELLAFQLGHGNDPALGGKTQAAAPKAPRPVLLRRVVKTRVIADAGSGTQTAAPVTSSGSSSSTASAPVTSSAPAPAPAPAAPVVSSSS